MKDFEVIVDVTIPVVVKVKAESAEQAGKLVDDCRVIEGAVRGHVTSNEGAGLIVDAWKIDQINELDGTE